VLNTYLLRLKRLHEKFLHEAGKFPTHTHIALRLTRGIQNSAHLRFDHKIMQAGNRNRIKS